MCLMSFLRVSCVAAAVYTAAISAFAQGQPNRLNPYTPSPVAAVTSSTPSLPVVERNAVKPSAATDRSTSFSATDIYRIGSGDVIFINITNSLTGKGYYQVRPDGTIDFPLAGERVIASGKTADAVARMLESSITLYRQPKVEVRIREYASHRVTLLGLVSNGGTRFIQREALPFYVICADAGINPAAKKVAIRDGRSKVITTYDLRHPDTANIVINAGDEMEFIGS